MRRRYQVLLTACIAVGLTNPTSGSAEDCIECHGKRGLSMEAGDGHTVSLYVDIVRLSSGVHGALHCLDCHGESLRQVPHPENVEPAKCERCHDEEASACDLSVHGPGQGRELGCAGCHGRHDIMPVGAPQSPVSPSRINGTCGRCHAAALASKNGLPGFEESTHATLIGGRPAALCTDCHGSHGITHVDDPESGDHQDSVSRTCGKCHSQVYAQYVRSVHGTARRQGIHDAPPCTGCHGAHSILASENPSSEVYAGNVPAACSRCHDEERITRKYGLATKRLETYESSFHGIANRYGEAVVANCASCHGVHDILPSSDPASSIAPNNLAATCGKCHVGAGANFAKGRVHVEATRESSRGMFYVRRFYTGLIGVLMVLFVIHIALDVAGYRRRKRMNAGES